METAKQLSVSLVNKPGRLADVLAALNKGKVDFRALVLMGSGERRTVRFVPDGIKTATAILERINVPYEVTDVLLVEISNHSGGFRKVCERLAAEHLSIDYAYCHCQGVRKAKGGVLAAFKLNDLAKARRALSENSTTRKKMPFRRLLLTR